jgi:hypothetical protein
MRRRGSGDWLGVNMKRFDLRKENSFSLGVCRPGLIVLTALSINALSWSLLIGQNIGITTPFTSAAGGYFESTGISWGFGLPGRGGPVFGLGPGGQVTPQIGFSWGGGNVIPPFGGYNPNAGAQLSATGNNFSFALNMAKGSTRTLTSQAPSMIVQNGSGGSFFSGQVSPFVIGMVPIVGDQPLDNAVTRAVQSGQLDLTYRPEESATPDRADYYYLSKSTATQGDQSVTAIKAQRARERVQRAQRFDELLADARQQLELGRRTEAREKLRKALELTDNEELKKVIRVQIQNLRPVYSRK